MEHVASTRSREFLNGLKHGAIDAMALLALSRIGSPWHAIALAIVRSLITRLAGISYCERLGRNLCVSFVPPKIKGEVVGFALASGAALLLLGRLVLVTRFDFDACLSFTIASWIACDLIAPKAEEREGDDDVED